MEGYEVITSDESKIGRVVETQGEFLIIEHGTLRKTRHAIPKTFAHTDERERVIRLSVSKDIIDSSPKLNGSLDEAAVAQHYGLAGGFAAPETQGDGDVVPDDPAWSAEQQQTQAGVPTATEQRVEIRERINDTGKDELPSSPGLLGDRYGK